MFFIRNFKKREINELEKELKKGNKKEIIKETGDVLRDAILLFYIISKNENIKEKKILENIIKKVKFRKTLDFSE